LPCTIFGGAALFVIFILIAFTFYLIAAFPASRLQAILMVRVTSKQVSRQVLLTLGAYLQSRERINSRHLGHSPHSGNEKTALGHGESSIKNKLRSLTGERRYTSRIRDLAPGVQYQDPSWCLRGRARSRYDPPLKEGFLVKPFYEDEYATLYHGDLREIKEWLTADALCVDPPYGRGWKQGSLHAWALDRKDDSHRGIAGDKTTEVRDAMLQLWGEDRPAIVFGDLMIPPPAGTKQVLVYQKPFDAGRRGAISGYHRDLEAVYLLGKWESGISTGRGSLLTTCVNMISGGAGLAGEYGHPHAKPLDVLEGLLRNLPPGSVVADPCAGSGTTLLAARNLGMRAIGVEVDGEYASKAAAHLAQQPLTMTG